MRPLKQFQIQISATVVATILLISHSVQSIRFNLNPNAKKCLKQEMYASQLAVGEYEVSSLPDTKVDIKITDSKGHIAFTRENIDGKGKFAVTSDKDDFYELCFTYTSTPGTPPQALAPREVSVDYRVGAEAKNYDTIDHDRLAIIEQDLNKIEDFTNAIILDFAYLKRREKEMRDTNESTNTRLFYQTVTSVIILLALTTWQVLYLRQFFRARKLID